MSVEDMSFILHDLKYSCKYYSGVVTITGGAGDVTVNIPFDWTDGYIIIVHSGTIDTWASIVAGDWFRHASSYDSLTNAAYTAGGHVISYASDATDLYIFPKTQNLFGIPKSATGTSVTLDDNGVTRYIKYFIWA